MYLTSIFSTTTPAATVQQQQQQQVRTIYNSEMEYDLLHASNNVIATSSNGSNNSKIILQNDENSLLLASSQINRMKVALGVVARLVVPLFNGVARGWQGIRDTSVLQVLNNVQASRQLLTNLLAFAANSVSLGLSTVQVVHKIDPLLKMMKIRKQTVPNRIALTIPPTAVAQRCLEDVPEKCVTLNVLAEPPPGSSIRADIVFIHGLHGSLVNTWKQGQWNSEGRRVNFQRPPKPPIRPPKRPRHSRTTLFDPPHRSKRPKFGGHNILSTTTSSSACTSTSSGVSLDGDSSNISDDFKILSDDCHIDYTYDCEYDSGANNNDVIEYYSDIEKSIPTFRLREEHDVPDMNDFNDSNYNDQRSDSGRSSTSNCGEYSRCWPGDWLPLDCPGVRVIALNYTTDPYLWRPIWIRKRNRTSLAARAREMMGLLSEIGVGVGHPIVWVGHSKGGIFIKQIMVDAWESGNAALAPLWRSSRGCLFYSVPHRGSPLADFNLPLMRQSIELVEIKKNSPGVLELHRRFVALYRSGHLKIDIFSFVETALTLMSVLYLRIVGIDSADPGIGEVCGVHLDHRQICKPRDRDCILYTKLTEMINKVS